MVESFTLTIRVSKGIWRKIRFSDMDINSMVRLCETVDEEYRFSFYKRIGDLCLFILGMFPESVTPGFPHLSGTGTPPQYLRGMGKSADDYEEEGRRFYRLAGEHKSARELEIAEAFQQLHENFNLARKPLNYISENIISFRKQKLFPPVTSS